MTTKKTETSVSPTAPKKISVKKAAAPTATAAANAEAAVPAVKTPRAQHAAKKPKKEAKVREAKAKELKVRETKVKVVRDSFTMPQDEYLKIAAIKEAALESGVPVKKSEVLRAGLKALIDMSPAQLKVALAGLEKIKTGRPKKH